MLVPSKSLWRALEPQLPGLSLELLEQVDSTNSELMRRARAGCWAPVLLCAQQQTAGRGRLGRSWHSDAGSALTFSLGLPLAPLDWSGLSLAVGLSVAQSLHPAIELKWPNDLYWQGRKLAGILLETSPMPEHRIAAQRGTPQPRYLVVGIGINIVRPELDQQDIAGAGLSEFMPALSAAQLLERIAPALVPAILHFATQGFAPLQAAFNARDALAQRHVKVSNGLSGVANGVDQSGALRLLTQQGEERLCSAEVSLRSAAPGATGQLAGAIPLAPAAP